MVHACAKCGLVAGEHELIELGRTLRVLIDLQTCRWVEDCEASVDVPFVGIYTKHDVDLNILYATDVLSVLPRIC